MKKLEEAIKNQPNPVTGALGYVFDGDQVEEYIKRIEKQFKTFKKTNVCIKRKPLNEHLAKFPSEADYEDIHIWCDKTQQWFLELQEIVVPELAKLLDVPQKDLSE